MSHFTVLVPAANEAELDRRLLPYYEYGCSSHYDELVKPYLEFENVEDEKRHDWETQSIKRIVIPETGELVSPYDDRFKVETGSLGLFKQYGYEVPDTYLRRLVPVRELFTFEEYIADCGYEKTDQGYGYWHNPNDKWDWYQVGGRWDGLLLLRAGGSASIARVRDIDFEGTREAFRASAAEKWDNVDAALKSFDPDLTVEAFYSKPDDAKHLIMEGLRAKAKLTGVHDAVYHVMFFEPDGATSRAEYIEQAGKSALTYAFIDLDGQWFATGQMLMFGVTTDKQPTYDDAFWTFIGTLQPEQTLYVVDCHI